MPWAPFPLTWAVRLARGGAWSPQSGMRDQTLWPEHAAFMDGLAADGFVLLGGPLWGDGTALLVVEAATAQEIDDRLAPDPWLQHDLLRIEEIRRWEILLRRPEPQ